MPMLTTPSARSTASQQSQAAAVTRRLERPGGTLAYDERGDGPLVVLMPGLGDLRQQYRFLAPALVAAGFRVLSVDLRGHGESSVHWPDYRRVSHAEDLVALIEGAAAGPALVVGHSFSGAPAVVAAAERPDLVRGLVLVGPFVRIHEAPPLTRLAMALLFNGPWRVRAWGAYYRSLYPTRRPDDLAEHVRLVTANLAQPGRFDAMRAMIDGREPEVEARLADVAAPSLVVMGSKDADFPDPAAEAAWIAERLGGDVHLVEGAGHYPHVEEADAVAARIVDFAREVVGAR
jgi:pimeloyl-ACP methyl ester carboxylesterase